MFLEILVIILFFIVVYLWFKNREWKIKFEKRVARSARTLSGKTLEKLVPFLKDFRYDPHDIRWLGDPIDLVIFDGYSSAKPNQIVFCEVKSGEGKLTKEQNKIKRLVEKKKVKWEEFKI